LLVAAANVATAQWPVPEKLRLPGPPDTGAPEWAADGIDRSGSSPSPLAEFQQKLQKLKEERDALKDDRKSTNRWLEDDDRPAGGDIYNLQYRLSGLLMQMTSGKSPAIRPVPFFTPTRDPAKSPEKRPGWEAPPPKGAEGDSTVAKVLESKEKTKGDPNRYVNAPNPLALGMALFKAGNHQDALHVFRLVPTDGLPTGEKMPIKYLVATCLRKQGTFDEAANLYREVANYGGDETLAVCAQWQLASLRWHKETRDRLESIRARRLALEKGR